MDSDDGRSPDDPPPEPHGPCAAQLHRPARPWGTETSASYRRDAEQQEIDAEQRDTLAALHAAQLDEREHLQDDREVLRNAYHNKRVQAADVREQGADDRDLVADIRDLAADERDRAADLREVQADERELTALERHMQADARDANADQRELESQIDPKSYTTESQPRSDAGET